MTCCFKGYEKELKNAIASVQFTTNEKKYPGVEVLRAINMVGDLLFFLNNIYFCYWPDDGEGINTDNINIDYMNNMVSEYFKDKPELILDYKNLTNKINKQIANPNEKVEFNKEDIDKARNILFHIYLSFEEMNEETFKKFLEDKNNLLFGNNVGEIFEGHDDETEKSRIEDIYRRIHISHFYNTHPDLKEDEKKLLEVPTNPEIISIKNALLKSLEEDKSLNLKDDCAFFVQSFLAQFSNEYNSTSDKIYYIISNKSIEEQANIFANCIYNLFIENQYVFFNVLGSTAQNSECRTKDFRNILKNTIIAEDDNFIKKHYINFGSENGLTEEKTLSIVSKYDFNAKDNFGQPATLSYFIEEQAKIEKEKIEQQRREQENLQIVKQQLSTAVDEIENNNEKSKTENKDNLKSKSAPRTTTNYIPSAIHVNAPRVYRDYINNNITWLTEKQNKVNSNNPSRQNLTFWQRF